MMLQHDLGNVPGDVDVLEDVEDLVGPIVTAR